MKNIFLLFCIMFSLNSHAQNFDQETWNKFHEKGDVDYKVDKNILGWIKVSTYSSSKEESEMIMKYVEESILSANTFFNQPNIKRCNKKNLMVFFIDDNILNNQDLMSFLGWEKWNRLDINGAYEGVYAPRKTGVIFLSKTPSGKDVRQLVSHEVAHYWQDTHCGLPISETSAWAFEKHYIENR